MPGKQHLLAGGWANYPWNDVQLQGSHSVSDCNRAEHRGHADRQGAGTDSSHSERELNHRPVGALILGRTSSPAGGVQGRITNSFAPSASGQTTLNPF